MDLRFSVLRPHDLLALRVRAVNLRLDTSDPARPRLVRDPPAAPALLVFGFQPQSIAEAAYFETAPPPPPPFDPTKLDPPVPPPSSPPGTSDTPLPPGSTPARMSGGSRLVFRLPDHVDEIPYTTAGLLDWSRLELVLPPGATVPPGATNAPQHSPPSIAEPESLETAIELPYRLLLAPNVSSHAVPAWVHATDVVEHEGRAELWHTRLASRSTGAARPDAEASPTNRLPVRAVWSPDFVADGDLPPHSRDDDPFTPLRAAMSPRDRDQIVILSSGFVGYTLTDENGTPHPYVPRPVAAERLHLSALGAWLTSRGSWDFPVSYRYLRTVPVVPHHAAAPELIVLPTEVAPLDLVEWDHIATQGRDHYVRIVYEGFLYPFGHRATLVKVTERKVLSPHGVSGNPDASPVAYLRQRMYIVVREREKTYAHSPFVHSGREMPLRERVRINVRVTPNIDPPAYIGTASFWVDVNTAHYPFAAVGRDEAGSDAEFLAPMIFVGLSETNLGAVATEYVKSDEGRRCAVRGRNIAYADPTQGDTVVKTTSLYFTSQLSTAPPPYVEAPFLPVLDQAAVTAPALSALIGDNRAVPIKLYDDYLAHGLDPHAGVFAQIVGDPPPVAFSADKSGGFARPNIALSGLSSRKGLVSGAPTDAAAGVIDPAAYFGDIDAKLFGTIDLGKLIPLDKVTKKADAAVNAPEIRTRAIPNRKHPKRIVTIINWEPQLQDYEDLPVSINFNADGQTSALRLHVRLEDHLDGTPPTSVARGRLSNFEVRLLKVIGLKIDAIRFDSSNGAKSTVTLQLAQKDPIGFQGPLEFVQTLADLLPPGLFGGSGPSIKLTPTALRVTYTLGLPPVTTGVFSLEHISIMAGLDLPYLDGKPAVEFAFATRGRPFLLTVEIFGGGGFVHVVLDADGIRMIEGALEFGGNYSLDLGVASGAVHALAGIYFQLKDNYSDLTGFVDIGGEVNVLGLISVSIDLNISLSWQSSPSGNVIEGRATMTVSVHVLFFSTSVSLSVERSFSAGDGGHMVTRIEQRVRAVGGSGVKIDQVLSATQWTEYAGAFA
jgi:hypothetical protein